MKGRLVLPDLDAPRRRRAARCFLYCVCALLMVCVTIAAAVRWTAGEAGRADVIVPLLLVMIASFGMAAARSLRGRVRVVVIRYRVTGTPVPCESGGCGWRYCVTRLPAAGIWAQGLADEHIVSDGFLSRGTPVPPLTFEEVVSSATSAVRMDLARLGKRLGGFPWLEDCADSGGQS